MKGSLPIRNAIVAAKLTPASLKAEMNKGLAEKSGEIYSKIRDRYITAVEKIPNEEFKEDKDRLFRDSFIKDLRSYDLTSYKGRERFCFHLYNVDMAGSGMKVL